MLFVTWSAFFYAFMAILAFESILRLLCIFLRFCWAGLVLAL